MHAQDGADGRGRVRLLLDPPLCLPRPGAAGSRCFAAYATSVGLNSILPANLGTAVMLVMLTLIIPGATFAGILAVYAVQKIFFVVIGAFPYLYLFLTVGGSFDLQFGFIKDHPWAVAVVLIGGAILIALRRPDVLAARPQVVGPGEGGRPDPLPPPRVLRLGRSRPRRSRGSRASCVMAVFLAAYDIPVTFHTLMRIIGRQLDRERDLGHARVAQA